MIDINLVYLSYGSVVEYRRAVMSILSFSVWNHNELVSTRVIVYTDNINYFQPYLGHLNVVYYFLTADMLQRMLGGNDLIHRRKVTVIDWTFKKFPKADLIFIDTDTFFTIKANKLFESIKAGQFFMHKREYKLDDALQAFSSFGQGQYPKAFIKLISEKSFLINGISEIFTSNDFSWNSGVLGLNRSFADNMKYVFKLTDEFYSHSKWFISEQLAFSLILQRQSEIKPAEEFIFHYWGKRQKRLVDGLINQLFNQMPLHKLSDMNFIRGLTLEWKTKIEIDILLEQVRIGLSKSSYFYALKKCVQIILKRPFNPGLYKRLRCVINHD